MKLPYFFTIVALLPYQLMFGHKTYLSINSNYRTIVLNTKTVMPQKFPCSYTKDVAYTFDKNKRKIFLSKNVTTNKQVSVADFIYE